MGYCDFCLKKNNYWFSNQTCESCTKLQYLVRAIGSEKVARSLSVRLKEIKSSAD